MLNKPTDLREDLLLDALRTRWGLGATASGMEYLPVGFGSHHWQVTDDHGDRWFLTIDDLASRKNRGNEPLDSVHARLSAALTTARLIADADVRFVVAPIRCADGDIVARIGPSYTAALYPYVDGRMRQFGDALTRDDCDRVTGVLATLHAIPTSVALDSPVENFELRHRAALAGALDDVATPWDTGPYAKPARALLIDHAARIDGMLARYDRLADQGRAQPQRMVLTHGEPHPGNFIQAAGNWLLVDWDTAAIAPPERDLWHIGTADDPQHSAYTDMTGTAVEASMLEFYRLSWTLADIAAYVRDFREPHTDDANGRASLTYMAAALQS
jgi:aminoglycoside phosphotransferase (APT) family kinase protein